MVFLSGLLSREQHVRCSDRGVDGRGDQNLSFCLFFIFRSCAFLWIFRNAFLLSGGSAETQPPEREFRFWSFRFFLLTDSFMQLHPVHPHVPFISESRSPESPTRSVSELSELSGESESEFTEFEQLRIQLGWYLDQCQQRERLYRFGRERSLFFCSGSVPLSLSP